MSAVDDRRAVALAFGRLDHVGSGRMRQMIAFDDPRQAWSMVELQSDGLLVLNGGEDLKAQFPVGVSEPIRLVNTEGTETTVYFTRY